LTMIANPFGKIHLCAVVGGKVMVDDAPGGGAAFRLTMPNNRAAKKKFATGMRYICEIWNDEARMSNDEGNPNDEA